MKHHRFTRTIAIGLGLALAVCGNANAGWGSSGGSFGSYGGGSSGGSSGGGCWGSGGGSSGGGSTGLGLFRGGGSSGGGSFGGASLGSSGGSSGRVGLFQRLANRIAAKRARHSHGSSGGGSWGGSSGGSQGSYVSYSGGSHGSSGGSSGGFSTVYSAPAISYAAPIEQSGYVDSGYTEGTIIDNGYVDGGYIDNGTVIDGGYQEGTIINGGGIIEGGVIEGGVIDGGSYDGGVIDGGVDPVPSDTGIIEGSTSRLQNNTRGILTVSVPSDAKVFVNGKLTKSTGELRRYVSKGMKDGEQYRYQVRAEVERNGKTIDQTRVVSLRAGRVTKLAFGLEQQPVETSLTLRVPKDAKVILSGVNTKASGQVRKYATKKIAKGVKWVDYTVQVVMNRDGRTITKEKDITIRGGDQIELAFDFDETQLADAR